MNKWNSTKVHNPTFRRQLEYNNLGGGGGTVPVEGDFTTSSSTDGVVTIELGFRPRCIMVDLPIDSSGRTTNAVYSEGIGTNKVVYSIWDLHPVESRYYVLDLNSGGGESGISGVTDTGFKFRAHGGNTTNRKCHYIAFR